jgi:thiol-disulfide isomerase/thioredoxin
MMKVTTKPSPGARETMKSNTAKAGTAKASTAKASTAKASTAKASTVKASTAKASTVKASTVKASTAKASTAKASTAKASTAKTNNAKTNNVKTSENAKTGATAKTSANAKTSATANTNTRTPNKQTHSNSVKTTPSSRSKANTALPRTRTGEVVQFSGHEDGYKAVTHSNARELTGRAALVLVYSDMCGYCHQLRPTWEAVKADVKSAGVDVVEYDIQTLNAAPPGSSQTLDDIRSNVVGVPYIAKLYPDQTVRPFIGDRTVTGIIAFALGDHDDVNTRQLARLW